VKGCWTGRVDSLGGECNASRLPCPRPDADIYLLDEPSAYLDSNNAWSARTIRRVMEKGPGPVDRRSHVYFLDMVSDSLMVFSGEPGRAASARDLPMRDG